jgi:hypothetical protein
MSTNLQDCISGPMAVPEDSTRPLQIAQAINTYAGISTFNATTTKKPYKMKSESERLLNKIGKGIIGCG